MKQILIETWFTFSLFVWGLNLISLIMLPQMMWDWFHLVGFFIGTSINLIIALNVLLNRVYKLNKL